MTQPEKSLGKRLAGFGVAGATLVGSLAACGGDSDESITSTPTSVATEQPGVTNGEGSVDQNSAQSIGELIVTADMVDIGYCASIAEESFSYTLDTDNNVVEAGEDYERTVERSYIPQSVAAILAVNYDKAANGEEGYKLFSDAVSTPITGNLNEVTDEIKARLCEDPLYLEHLITGFGQITGTNGEKVADLNPWMSTDVSTIDDRAESVLWNTGVFNRTTQEIETLSNAEIINRMNTHEERAAYMIEMIERYFEADRFAEDKMTVYHIGIRGAEVGEPGDLPEMIDYSKPEHQYVGNFVIFQYTNKDGRCVEVGLNLGDGRFAKVVDGVCEIVTDDTTTTTPDTTTPDTTTPDTTTPDTTTPDTTTSSLPDHAPGTRPTVVDIPPQQVGSTPGYNSGDAETNEGSQNTIADGEPAPNNGEPTENGTQIEDTAGTGAQGPTVGENGDGVTDSPDPETAPTNPDYNPDDESTDYQSGEGNSDPEETEASEDTNSGDPNPGVGGSPGGF